jgi:VWFA-related protein
MVRPAVAGGPPMTTARRPDGTPGFQVGVSVARDNGASFRVTYPGRGIEVLSWWPTGTTRTSVLAILPVSDRSAIRRPRPEAIFADAESEWAKRQSKYGDNMEEYLDMLVKSRPQREAPPRDPANAGTIAAAGGDRFADWRESTIAIAVPAKIYRGHQGDGAALAASASWTGLLGSQPGWSAALPQSLVDLFHQKDSSLPGYLPVCAVTAKPVSTLDDAGPGATAEPGAAEGPAERVSTGRNAMFRSSATLVSVPVSLTPPVAGLGSGAFRVFEDDVEQTIDRIDIGTTPTDITLLIDTSSGMRGAADNIRRAAEILAYNLRPDDRVMVATFDRRIHVLSELTSERSDTQRALGQMTNSGITRLYDAIALTMVDRLRAGERRKVMVLFTDGVDTGSQLTDARGALAAVDVENVSVYVVRYDTLDAPTQGLRLSTGTSVLLRDTQKSPAAVEEADLFLQRLAEDSGGRYYLAEPGAMASGLFADIAADIHGQYLLRYYAKNDKLDGSYRAIKVTVDQPGSTIRARAGYRAGVLQVGR